MADTVRIIDGTNGLLEKVKDNGDGTFSVGGGGIPTGNFATGTQFSNNYLGQVVAMQGPRWIYSPRLGFVNEVTFDYDARLASSAASNNLTQVNGNYSIRVGAISCDNNAAYPIYLKFFYSGGNTVGTSTPLYIVAIPAGVKGWAAPWPANGKASVQGQTLYYALVKGAADTDNTAVAAGDITNLRIDFGY